MVVPTWSSSGGRRGSTGPSSRATSASAPGSGAMPNSGAMPRWLIVSAVVGDEAVFEQGRAGGDAVAGDRRGLPEPAEGPPDHRAEPGGAGLEVGAEQAAERVEVVAGDDRPAVGHGLDELGIAVVDEVIDVESASAGEAAEIARVVGVAVQDAGRRCVRAPRGDAPGAGRIGAGRAGRPGSPRPRRRGGAPVRRGPSRRRGPCSPIPPRDSRRRSRRGAAPRQGAAGAGGRGAGCGQPGGPGGPGG